MVVNAPTASDVHAILGRADALRERYSALVTRTRQVSSWLPPSAYIELSHVSLEQKAIDGQADQLHADIRTMLQTLQIAVPVAVMLAGAAVGNVFAEQLVQVVQSQRHSSQCVLAMQQVQDASSGASALIERKYAYAFGYIALYIGVLLALPSLLPSSKNLQSAVVPAASQAK